MTLQPSLGAIVFGFAAFAYAALALWLASGWRNAGPGRWLVIAAVGSFVWCFVSALDYATGGSGTVLVSITYLLRTATWCMFLTVLVRKATEAVPGTTGKWWQTLAAIMGAIFLFLLVIDLGIIFGGDASADFEAWRQAFRGYGALLLAVGGMALLENVYRLPDPDGRWSLRFLVLALGGAFAFDLVLNTAQVLFHHHDATLWLARGAINALIVPMIALTAARNPKWKLDIYVSRQVAFHTVSLIAAGIYLIVTSLAAVYIATFEGDFASLLLTVFVFAAVIALFVLLGSGQMRARLRVFISKHFFAYSYDYREEWLSFIHTISDTARSEDLRVRIIRAMCDILDSPGGALWLKAPDGSWRPVVRWNLRGGFDGSELPDSPLIRALSDETWIIDLNELKAGDPFYGSLPVPEWAASEPRAWLLVPLLHYGAFEGFLMAEQPRSPQDLSWEGRDLLKTAGRQAASYLAEQRAEHAAQEAREFEAFNRRFAYVMHDVKNLLSQLKLVLKNAETHADNPEFQKDMLETVKDAAEKMSHLLERLSRQTEQGLDVEDVNLVALAEEIAGRFRASHGTVPVDAATARVWVAGNAERLSTALAHLVQNGFEAGAGKDGVRIEISVEEPNAILKVVDCGSGMTQDFIENELFRPFRTTKAAGYGIGVYEVRAIVEAHGGRLEVASRPGEGTIFVMRLPLGKRMTAQSDVRRPTEQATK